MIRRRLKSTELTYAALRAEQADFFSGRGFQLYPRAYSRHSSTLNALPSVS